MKKKREIITHTHILLSIGYSFLINAMHRHIAIDGDDDGRWRTERTRTRTRTYICTYAKQLRIFHFLYRIVDGAVIPHRRCTSRSNLSKFVSTPGKFASISEHNEQKEVRRISKSSGSHLVTNIRWSYVGIDLECTGAPLAYVQDEF